MQELSESQTVIPNNALIPADAVHLSTMGEGVEIAMTTESFMIMCSLTKDEAPEFGDRLKQLAAEK